MRYLKARFSDKRLSLLTRPRKLFLQGMLVVSVDLDVFGWTFVFPVESGFTIVRMIKHTSTS